MSHLIYYGGGCDHDLPLHICNDCNVPEHGRVRSVAFIKKTFRFTDPSNPQEWRSGIIDGDIIIIPQVLGSYNGGEPVEGPGYGDTISKITGYNFELAFKDPNYTDNAGFYNAIKRNHIWLIAFRSETLTHMSTNTISIVPKNPITENLNDEVVWDVIVKFSQADLPEPFPTPDGIFQCFDLTI